MNTTSITIALPVFNNEQHLSKTLDSILAQSFTDFVLYLSDDCSTDNTAEICRDYAKIDSRVIFSANQYNLGAIDNHQKLLNLATSPYFMFARGHEILPLNLLTDCLALLERDPSIALAYAKSEWINDEDQVITNKHLSYFDTRDCDVVTRCSLVFLGKYEYFYGLTRTEAMKRVRGLEKIMAHDLIMLLEMALEGSFACINKGVRYRRYYYVENYHERIKRYQETTIKNINYVEPGFPICLPQMAPLYTREPPRARNPVRRTIVQLQRPSPQPTLTWNRPEPLLSGHFSDTAPHLCPFFASLRCTRPRVSLPAPAAPRSSAASRRRAAGSDDLPPAGASSIWRALPAGPQFSPAAAGDSSATSA